MHTVEYGNREVSIVNVRFLDAAGRETGAMTTGQPMAVEISYQATRRIERPVFGFSIKTGNGMFVFAPTPNWRAAGSKPLKAPAAFCCIWTRSA